MYLAGIANDHFGTHLPIITYCITCLSQESAGFFMFADNKAEDCKVFHVFDRYLYIVEVLCSLFTVIRYYGDFGHVGPSVKEDK